MFEAYTSLVLAA